MSQRFKLIVSLWWIAISLAFLGSVWMLGGAAITGKIVTGHYFVGMHGHYPEVSRGTYVLSAVLSALFSVSFPVFVAVMNWGPSRKPAFNPFMRIALLLALFMGLGFCFSSIRCIVNAF
jgi:hypothetical protein